MSCGHDGCTCGPGNQTAEQDTRHERLPTIGEHPRDDTGCCGGHGRHHRQHDEEARAGQHQPRP